MTTISLHYWAGARAAAGTETESWPASSIAEALEAARQVRADPAFLPCLKRLLSAWWTGRSSEPRTSIGPWIAR